jgi:hypothetical protein
MANEPLIKKTFELPYNFVFSVKVTPWTMKRTVFKLLPWAIVAMLPKSGKMRFVRGRMAALSPLLKQRSR